MNLQLCPITSSLVILTLGISLIRAEMAKDVKGILDGGKEIELGEFPWSIGIVLSSTGKLFCGGSILTEFHVLTAARCVHQWLDNGTLVQIPPQSIKVIGGDNNRMEEESTEQTLNVEQIILHPGFQFDESYQTPATGKIESKEAKKNEFLNDIAILLVSPPGFNFTLGYVQPIRISDGLGNELLEPEEQEVTIVGWGITDKKQNTIPTGKLLKKVELPWRKETLKGNLFGLYEMKEEESIIGFNSGIGNNKGLMGRCIGDPGGAILCKKEGRSSKEDRKKRIDRGMIEICGVITFGIWCDRHYPSGRMSNLKYYGDWIDSHINSYSIQAAIGIAVLGVLLGVIGIVALIIKRKKQNSSESFRM